MPTKGRDSLDAEVDALFRLPLSEFTSARNALAAKLKKTGRATDAEGVKALVKPPVPAWAVNQLYWQDPEAIDQLLDVAERIRKVQTGRLKNVDARELLNDKKRRSAGLVEQATSILSAAGHAASPDVLRRVSATLESLAVWGKTEGRPQAGRLTADLDPPGFDALAALMDGAKVGSGKVLLFQAPKPAMDRSAARAQAREAAREAVQHAEKVLREARHEAGRAQTALTKADARTAAVEREKQEIEARYVEAKEGARAASNEAKKAAQAVTDAERSLAKAKAALE
jgi:hypothetical protein